MNNMPLIKKAKQGTNNTRTTLVFPPHLDWLMKYVSKLKNGKMVECGVARGGCIALCHRANPNLEIIGLDSWEPMPNITAKDDHNKCKRWVGSSWGTMEDVEKSYKTLGASSKNLKLIRGFFEESIPQNKELFENMDILRLDCDFHKAVLYCLETLYDKVKPGGLIIFDDWHYNPKGVRGAAKEFFTKKGINPTIHIHKKGAGPSYFFKNNDV